VPDRADKFDADTLNPLLNPLLASNMGRWAEVYFTSPPEKREQAVSGLLRELEDVAAPATAPVQGVAGMTAKESAETVDPAHSSASAFELVHTCEVCAYNNSAGHSFCGMCGAPLQIGPETDVQQDVPRDDVPQVAEAAPIPAQSWHERSLGPNSVEEMIEAAVRSSAAPEATPALEASWRRTERNLPYRGVKSDPPPNRYRLYVGAEPKPAPKQPLRRLHLSAQRRNLRRLSPHNRRAQPRALRRPALNLVPRFNARRQLSRAHQRVKLLIRELRFRTSRCRQALPPFQLAPSHLAPSPVHKMARGSWP
jgi:hypothetical protein